MYTMYTLSTTGFINTHTTYICNFKKFISRSKTVPNGDVGGVETVLLVI